MANIRRCTECIESCKNKSKQLAGSTDMKPFRVKMIRTAAPSSSRACCMVFGYGDVKSFTRQEAKCFEWDVEFQYDAIFND